MTKITKAVDCATVLTASSAQAIKTAGYGAVLRYLGSWSKSLGANEPAAILDVGLSLGLIWESSPTSAKYFTMAQAKSDVQAAAASAQSLGAPPGPGIAFPVDYNAASADMSAIVAYFGEIINQITDYKPGAYGDFAVLTALYQTYGEKLFYWQTSGWSNGQKFAQASLYQHVYDQSIGGVACDVDEVSGDPCWWIVANKTVGGSRVTTKYPAVQAQLNGKSVLAVAVGNVTYLIWTVARDIGLNITKADLGDVEIDGKKPPQVAQEDNTYIAWGSIPGLTAHKLDGGGFNFTTTPTAPATHVYTLVATEPTTATAGDWATLTIQTLDNGQPLGHQVITISENGVEADHDYTDATTGSYVWQITETTDKTDTMAVSWTDPAGKTHTVDKSTAFSVPQSTAAPIPSDDTTVAVIPAQITNDQVLLDAQTTEGKTLHMQLDTGAQTVTLTAADATILGLSDPGGSADISVQGVTGSSKAYIATITLVLGGVTFSGIEAVVDADFNGPSLLGYDTFAGQYDLLVSQKHNSVTVLK